MRGEIRKESKKRASAIMSQETKRISTKEQMYSMYFRGLFGNRPRTWKSMQEVLESNYQGAVSLRCKSINNPFKLYHVPIQDLKQAIEKIPLETIREGLVFSEAHTDAKRVIQGEVSRIAYGDLAGLCFEYTYAPYPMRIAFEHSRQSVTGLGAKMLLQSKLKPTDYDHLEYLLDEYPGCVVELSSFSIPVGILPGSNCLFWEVRNY